MHDLAIIILAAGRSSRLGQPKQLVEINREPLITKQCKLALDITPHVYCVLGFQFESIAHVVSLLPITVIKNSEWQVGMSSSIACAVNALPLCINRVLVLLVDQWQLDKHTLDNFLQTSEQYPSKIHVCKRVIHEYQFGPPAIFPRLYFDDLENITGEQGAKSFILEHEDHVIYQELPEAFIDLDDVNDLNALRKVYIF